MRPDCGGSMGFSDWGGGQWVGSECWETFVEQRNAIGMKLLEVLVDRVHDEGLRSERVALILVSN